MARHCALIAGVSGAVGRALGKYLAAHEDWEVIGLARRVPPRSLDYPVISVDLTDAGACRAALGELKNVTHVLYCARAAHTAAVREPIDVNLAMLRNLLDAIEPVAPGLAHVHFVQGSKVYGSDLGPYKTPARESDPRVGEYNWYYAQEDLIVERSRGRRWSWSASRPHGVCDREPVPRSLAMVIAIYAAISKELGQPLHFPGTAGSFHALYQCVDATLLAKAIAWISTAPACANQAFNVTNGDLIRWANLWPGFAGFFGMKAGPVKTVRLSEVMTDKAPVWERIVNKYRLKPTPYEKTAAWPYGDFNFGRDYDIMSSTLKLRQTGFRDSIDTSRMLLEHLGHFRQQRIIP
ncbi:MAG: SDR family oxidoreductase [Betaproteobacteria bacterium]|nr:SDR family oxidoreductase [Betaproteobacteria bacterium]